MKIWPHRLFLLPMGVLQSKFGDPTSKSDKTPLGGGSGFWLGDPLSLTCKSSEYLDTLLKQRLDIAERFFGLKVPTLSEEKNTPCLHRYYWKNWQHGSTRKHMEKSWSLFIIIEKTLCAHYPSPALERFCDCESISPRGSVYICHFIFFQFLLINFSFVF